MKQFFMKQLYLVNCNAFNTLIPLNPSVPDSRPCFSTNASIAFKDGVPIVILRRSNYCHLPWRSPDVSNMIFLQDSVPGHIIHSHNHIGILTESGFETKRIIDTKGRYTLWGAYSGLEDVKLVVWDNTLYGLGTRPDVLPDCAVQVLMRFNDDMYVDKAWFLTGSSKIEKNWVPVAGKDFTILYDPNTGYTIQLDLDKLTPASDFENPSPNEINKVETPTFTGPSSGSTQVIPFEDGYITIVHKRVDHPDYCGGRKVFYDHRIIRYNSDFSVKSIGSGFRFLTEGIEFCCGLAYNDGFYYITFSVGDCASFVLKMEEKVFKSLPIDRVKLEVDNEEYQQFLKMNTECEADSILQSNWQDIKDAGSQMALTIGYRDSSRIDLLYDSIQSLDDNFRIFESNPDMMNRILAYAILRNPGDTETNPWASKLMKKIKL